MKIKKPKSRTIIEYQRFQLKPYNKIPTSDKCELEVRDGYFLIYVSIDGTGNTFKLSKEQMGEIVLI